LELSNDGPPKLAGTALLSDRQVTLLGDWVTKYLAAHQRDKFRLAVLSRLSAGMPGDAALKQSMRLTAMDEFGFDAEKLTAIGLGFTQDRVDTRRVGIPRKQRLRIRRGKHD
jgi:hypothetical protein